MSKGRLTLIMILLVLLTGRTTVSASSGARDAGSIYSIKQNRPAFPFYQDTKALLSASGLIYRCEPAPEGGGFFLLFTPFITRNLFASHDLPKPLLSTRFALLYKYTILFPFHSFW